MDHHDTLQAYCLQRVTGLMAHLNHLNTPYYSKPIHPSNSDHMSKSFNNLDLNSLDSSETSRNSQFNVNESCCCSQCGKANKKVKSLQKKFTVFHTQMSILRNFRLLKRFQNAVYCIIYLIDKQKKTKKKEKQKKMYRFKTKINFDASPIIPTQQQQVQNEKHDDKQNYRNQHMQSIQAKIIDSKHKQRQSIRVYLQQKLYEKDHQQKLPKIHKIAINSFTTIQPLRFSKNDEQKSSRFSSQIKITPQTEFSPTSLHHQSPYFSNITSRNQVDSIIQTSFKNSTRTIIKSISSEQLIQKQQKHQFHSRKNTPSTLKGIF
ncbi:unnamed protein product (macronuclear) [Paramecium tetraurelia]|uniref:Uncharacterized protein n=1 Tax=Paramecium tetraurelia TaxID=5888 RepID=A0D5M9_PARTE|nr:uncharacterized protein GSPATT00013776001 [Paramecium tetraurelia]CAK78346.1 unnamed protein product [Paramecium tetraurelia]|eukprot:XP_001445743.1 hypothetical protein (macronuclear) [Paramecium tetraurelia strain d4-2]